MSHLYSHLRVHQIFGANTDVGKTIFATALCLASSTRGPVHYLKPVSTGALDDADKSHLQRFAPRVASHTLYQFNDPVSPHLAATRVADPPPTDEQLLSGIDSHLASTAASASSASSYYLETAGGVHSPTPSGSSTATALRPLRLPTLLVADPLLGGISTTRSAYDSLVLAGHDVRGILIFPDAGRGWGNAEYLRRWAEEDAQVKFWALGGPRGEALPWGHPPERAASRSEDEARMKEYYAGLVRGRSEGREADEDAGGVAGVVEFLEEQHRQRLRELESMAPRTRESCWWPFTQHTLVKSDADVNVIDSAHGDFFSIYNSKAVSPASVIDPVLDGSASWWTQCLGHADAGLTLAAARAASRYGHVLFPTGANEPSLRLSESLLGRLPDKPWTSRPRSGLDPAVAPGRGWASRVFFSDDGSTGMEVALKMAVASSVLRYSGPGTSSDKAAERVAKGRKAGTLAGRPKREWEVLGLKGSYHGDTIGAMDACEGGIYNSAVEWYRGRGRWFEPPVVGVVDGVAQVRLPLADEDWSHASEAPAETRYSSLAAIYDVASRLETDPLAKVYKEQIRRWLEHLVRVEGRQFGALVLEPLVMGAGGMICVDPLFQRCLVDVVRASEDLFALTDPPLDARVPLGEHGEGWRGLPVIYDEVFTGLWRLGVSTPAHVIGADPDISVLAKILTGGMVPMAVTLANKSIFSTFDRSDKKVDALLHGHSYTAHPIGCEVANETLARIDAMRDSPSWRQAQRDWAPSAQSGAAESSSAPSVWSFWSSDAVHALSKREGVSSAMALGTVLIVELKDNAGGGYASTASVDLLATLRHELPERSDFKIHARPLGNVVYFMCSLNTPESVRRATEASLLSAIQ